MQISTPLQMANGQRRLLIVQRNSFAARSLARYFDAHFDAVEMANDAPSAEVVLNDPGRTPTHLVCGQDLGVGNPLGTEVIPRWRKAYPGVVCVVMATGHHELPETLEGVDAVFLKPSSPATLLPIFAQQP